MVQSTLPSDHVAYIDTLQYIFEDANNAPDWSPENSGKFSLSSAYELVLPVPGT